MAAGTEGRQVRCRACGAVVAERARFCHECGARIRARANAPDAASVSDPARSMPAASSSSQTAPAPPGPAIPVGSAEAAASGTQGDRRIVTALFADLVDYVRLVAEHDAEDVRRRVDAALRAMVDAIERFDGTPEKFIGDAVFAVFGWPVAHDDDALRATHCALAIRDSIGRLQDPAGETLQVRIGLATGEVVAAPRGVPGALDWSLTGPAVTTAARIQGEAAPDEILLDDATRHAARKTLAVEDLGERVLRGQRRPVRIARLLGEAGFQPWQPPVGRFVGRTLERRLLGTLAEALGERGEGGVAVVQGEPGIGKSRLLSDVLADARRIGAAWTWVDNVSYGSGDPYRFGRSLAQTIADEHGVDSGSFLRQLLLSGDVDERDARRWAGAVAAIARDAAFSGWEAEAALVPPDPAEVGTAVRSLARAYVERLIDLDGPRVIVVDDLQWLDPSSAGIFEELVDVALRQPLLVLIGTRPMASLHPCLVRPEVRHLSLAGLDEPETAELAEALAGVTVASADARRLHLRTGGNPLFIGETVRASVDEGAITADGRLAIGGSDGAAVPVTLRALLGSRIDALAADARTVLRVGAVLGMTFREAVVEDVLVEPVEPTVYDRLADAALIVPLDGRGGWRFCHPLIHDAAYRSLLSTDRATLHARIADRIEARQPDPPVAAIARHRAAAGDATRAIPLLLQAAELAGSVGASAEAAGYLESAATLESDQQAAAELARRAAELRGATPVA
jgi:adenylate cyclase